MINKRNSEEAGLAANSKDKKTKAEPAPAASADAHGHGGHDEKKHEHENEKHGHEKHEHEKHEKHGHGEHGHGEHGHKECCKKTDCKEHGHGKHGHGHGDGHGHSHNSWVIKANVPKANELFAEGQQLFNIGRLSDALRKFTASILEMGFPSHEDIRKDPNVAAQALEKISGATWLILYYRAIVYFKLSNFSDASQDAGRALKLFERRFKTKTPTQEENNNYASTLWVRGSSLMEFGAYKEAEKHVKKALEILPGNEMWIETYDIIKEQVDHSKKLAEREAKRMAVTIITGFLGSGKTTLVNHILSANHGKKLAIVENEYGAENIDSALVGLKKEKTDEVIVEASNGCVCCTVRGDLIKAIVNLIEKYKDLDGILIETTGLADPTPVAQTFYMDQQISKIAKLDGIVAVCDSKYILQNLAEKKEHGAVNESKQQLAFADVILLNKTDLVSKEELAGVKKGVAAINSTAKTIETVRSVVDPSHLLGINAFSVERAMAVVPDFLDDRSTSHDEGISSFVVRIKAPVDIELFQDWIQGLLRERSADLYRSKGLISAVGSESKFVYHTVHEILEIEESEPWKKQDKRESVFVFIGKDLNRKEIEESMQDLIS